MKRACCFIAILLLLTSHYSVFAQSSEDSIISLPLKMPVPANAIKKGSIKVGNNATEMHCDYEEVIAEAKREAKGMGGNIVKITALIRPAFMSKCYKIEADVYYYSDLKDSILQRKTKKTGLSENPKDYVMLYIYRLSDTTMLEPNYPLHLNDESVLCFVKNKSRDSIKVYKDGPLTLWAKTAHRGELKLDTKFGETYYIRCGLTGGQFNTTPALERIDEKTGTAEYARVKKRHKDQDARYLQEIH